MLQVIEDRRHLNGWRRPLDATAEKRPLSFELLTNRICCNSATFSIYRAKIPGGWLVAMRPNDQLAFVPDPEHEWDGGSLS
jgi:hypothetical protein